MAFKLISFALLLFALAVEEDPRFGSATATSTGSGSWSDPGTWSTGLVPGQTDDVIIQFGHSVDFDVGSTQVQSLTVQSGALLFSQDGASSGPGVPGGNASSIRIDAGLDITIEGTMRTGNGGASAAITVNSGPGVAAVALGGQGGDGGSLELLSATGGIQIASTGALIVGDGGPGGTATAQGGDAVAAGAEGGDAEAHGGVGGNGGSLLLACALGNLSFAPVSGVIQGSNGGAGGESISRGGTGGNAGGGSQAGIGGSVIAGGGHGGSSGSFQIQCDSLNGRSSYSETELITLFQSLITGGDGGAAGLNSGIAGGNGFGNSPSSGDRAPCWDTRGKNGPKDEEGPTHGGDAWIKPSDGASAEATAGDGIGTGAGGSAKAAGGNGGNSELLGFKIKGFNLGVATAVTVGKAGSAKAVGGNGGPIGGDGGDAEATGGHSGVLRGAWIGGGCSRGGGAEAIGGDGSTGATCCTPPDTGQDGGDGGDATAMGGNSFWFGVTCRGGDAVTEPGSGGNGGDGCPPGLQGVRGGRTGAGGTGNPNGKHVERPANNGVPGNDCGPKTTDAFYGIQGGSLFRIDTRTLTASSVGLTGFTQIGGLAFGNNGVLYGIDSAGDQLLSINTTTGAATPIGPVGVPVNFSTGLGNDPTTNLLYGVSARGAGFSSFLETYAKATGAATGVADTTALAIVGIDFDSSGQLWGIDGATGHEELIRIDKTTGATTVIGPQGLAALPSTGGFDIDSSGTFWAIDTSQGLVTLYRIDSVSGAPTVVGQISGMSSGAVTGLASIGSCTLSVQVPNPRAGAVNMLVASCATPNGTVVIAGSKRPGSSPTPVCGLNWGLSNAIEFGTTADAAGVATVQAFVPAKAAGFQLPLQALDVTSCTLSAVELVLFL